MKRMIDEKAVKLAEALSETAVVENGDLILGKNLEVDGDLQVNGDTNINTLYNFDKEFSKEESGFYSVSLPLKSLVKSIRILIKNNNQWTEGVILKPIYDIDSIIGFIEVYEAQKSVKFISTTDYLTIQSAPSITIDSMNVGGEEENYISILDEDKNYDLLVITTYQVGNDNEYTI